MEFVSCHPSSSYSSEMSPRFLENSCIHGVNRNATGLKDPVMCLKMLIKIYVKIFKVPADRTIRLFFAFLV
jgi:hypothetical protein